MVKYAGALVMLLASVVSSAGDLHLSSTQADAFRGWFSRIVAEQLRQGPNPRWTNRDCAGLVRFAVNESFKTHNLAWLRANGLSQRYLPPELQLTVAQQRQGQKWQTTEGQASDYVPAWQLIQANTVLVGRDLNQAQRGDLLYFDQGDDQHLMIWLGDVIAYHTGQQRNGDSGLRSVSVHQLMTWKDTRWQPTAENPNFIGIFRLAFLAP